MRLLDAAKKKKKTIARYNSQIPIKSDRILLGVFCVQKAFRLPFVGVFAPHLRQTSCQSALQRANS